MRKTDNIKREGRKVIHTLLTALTIWAGAQIKMYLNIESKLLETQARLEACEKIQKQQVARLHE
jgi:hypothetical protein